MSVTTKHSSTYGIYVSNYHSSTYGIFISNQQEERYIISQSVPPTEFSSSYSILVSPGHQISYYDIITSSTHAAFYNICLSAQHDAKYSIKLTNTVKAIHKSKYNLTQIYYNDSVSFYKIRPDNFTSAEHFSYYRFLESMVRGITDRFACQWNAWDRINCERYIHLHLFNIKSNDRHIAYERYYSSYVEHNLVVQREIKFDERSIAFSHYSVHDNEMPIYLDSYRTMGCDRASITAAFDEFSSEREIHAVQLFHTQTERSCVWWSTWDTFRYCLCDTWYVSELWCVTHAKEMDKIASQRSMWAQIDEVHFESIRQILFDACSLSYDLTINPINTIFDYVISEQQNIIFDSQVTPDTSSYITMPVDDNLSDIDIIIIEKGTTKPIYCGRQSLIYLPFKQISSRTWMFDGYLSSFKDVSFLKTVFEFIDKGVYGTDQEYFDHLDEHGYFKIQINNTEMSYREATVSDIPANTLIPFKIWALDTEINKNNINILFKWAYPYTEIKINEVLLAARMEN